MNIASNETSGIDFTIVDIPGHSERLHLNVRLNEDGMGVTEIDYVLDQYDLHNLIDYLSEHLRKPL